MKRWTCALVLALLLAGGSALLCGGLLAASLFGYYPQPIRDVLDRRLLRRHFDLPPGLRLVDYDGYPPMVGFGQREGLNIRAVYQLSERQAEALIRRSVEMGWLPLPIPAETRDKVGPYVESTMMEVASGLYLCRTAGHNVLYAQETRRCAEAATLGDAILGVFDASTNRLYLQVGSGY